MNHMRQQTVRDESPSLEEIQSTKSSNALPVDQTVLVAQVTAELHVAKHKIKTYRKGTLCLSACICLMTLIIIIAIYAQNRYKLFPKVSKSKAIQIETEVLKQLVNGSNITDHYHELRKTYNAFDEDSDGVWCADELAEYLKTATSADDAFDAIDVDNDGILSFREVVAYIMTIDKESKLTSSIIEASYGYAIKQIYNYSLQIHDQLWYQYAANIFLNTYADAAINGYISADAFYGFYADQHFQNFDADSDGAINFYEFISDFFNEQLLELFRYIDVEAFYSHHNNEHEALDANLTQVQALNITMIPSVITKRIKPTAILPPAEQRRRLRYKHLGDDYTNYSAYYYIDSLPQTAGHRYCYITPHPDYDCASWEAKVLGRCCPRKPDKCMTCMSAIPKQCYACWRMKCETDSPSRDVWKDAPCFDDSSMNKEMGGAHGSTNNACFAPDSKIEVKKDERVDSIVLNELEIGDYVRGKSGQWTKVWFINNFYGEWEMMDLYFDDVQFISLTAHHLLYVHKMEEKYMKTAGEVRIGDIVFVKTKDMHFVEKEIVHIASRTVQNAFAPVTMDGSIVVNDVLASSYTRSVTNAKRLHDAGAVFRAISKVNTNLAAMLVNFFYNVVFKGMRLLKIENMLNGYSSPWIVIAVLMCITTSVGFVL